MKQRTATAIAAALFVATLLASGASFVMVWLSRAEPVADVIGFRGFDAIVAIVFACVGAVVVSRRPSHPVGWLLFGFGGGNAPVSLLQQYAFFALLGRGDPLQGGAVAAWAQEWISVSQGALFVLLLLLFPTGRLLAPRWRAVAWLAIVGSLLETMGAALKSGPIATFRTLDNPYGITGAPGGLVAIGDAVGNVLFLTTILAAVVSVILRYRRAESIERQQLKWIAASAVLVALGLIGFALTGQEGGGSAYARPAQIFLILGIIAIPISAGIAILRHRLFDIDRIVSRTLAYAVVTAVLGGTFALVALVPTAILGTGRRPDWIVALATLSVAALFRPVRRRVQRAIDVRFNRARYDAEHAVEAFAARLREQIDIDALGAELTDVVARTMQPVHVSLWVGDVMKAPEQHAQRNEVSDGR